MTNRIGNKDVAQQRSKSEKARIKAQNIASEAVKRAEDSPDCPICEVLRDGRPVGLVA